MPSYTRVSLLIVLSQAVVSCATQSIDPTGVVDPSNAATISADSEWNFLLPPATAVVMKEVDGVPVKGTVTKVSVSPGHHKLEVRCELINAARSYDQTLEIDALPKAKYILGVKVGGSAGPCEAVAVKAS
jgi:hypothetical protein